MNKINKLYYLAGFFDGEGTILLTRRYRKVRGARLSLSVRVVNTNKEIIEQYYKLWGGSIYQKQIEKSWHRQTYTWQVNAQKAENFLSDIKCFLQQKKREAIISLKFRNKQRELNKARVGAKGKGRPYTYEQIKILMNIREELLSCRGAAANRRRYDKK